MTIGTKIRNQRMKNKLSQKDLALKVGISEPSIRNYELGNRIPSRDILEKIADALNISVFALSDPSYDNNYSIIHSLF
ncbi:transcriptional regulator with XRE-family HTH domain [Breznakia sp. PF5-3]|uniref:helix-turn-helix domain-containing protein n=1 Tax=unclassified Breznakia TaxID=2623764 RepID=UPI002406FA57|nr:MULTISPECIES: helix-turn-helix transcriptional regulator [unclassified Breznakia]MDF9824497.1 transcriptional regulator with XRE-family HTH domain [Breznakia sp. PM6-1]MDF9835283.1 transcriptional regulator with XRE-family HTH domain [Breznakia sp. PF5-3]MDF9836999.1 transcriptional regulator with XRE-family HTH domain [Breznakia sp. PFB2-8]MDF9858924.1 transcriptional regulator with XRE-family HTH domain [Breznakia sp. PH5-24]